MCLTNLAFSVIKKINIAKNKLIFLKNKGIKMKHNCNTTFKK